MSDFINEDDFDMGFSEDYLADFYLDDEDHFLAPSTESWKDFLPFENHAVITMDSSKDIQWKLAKEEIVHVRQRLMSLLSVESLDPCV